MSRLVSPEQMPAFQLESFDTEEAPLSQEAPSEGGIPCIRIPLCGSRHRPARKPEAGDTREPGPPTEEEILDRVARLEREAYEKGFAQGRKDGLALEMKQVEKKDRELQSLLDSLARLKEQIYGEAEGELVKLGLAIAGKIIRKEVKAGHHRMEEIIRTATKYLVDASHMRIRVSPEDMEDVQRIVPSLAAATQANRIQIVEDRAIERGGCLLETGFGSVNATLQDQLGLLEKELDRVFQAGKGESP
ncbi:MAG: FliH/SctL family protein [Thermodesulfobacteriota bacterium]